MWGSFEKKSSLTVLCSFPKVFMQDNYRNFRIFRRLGFAKRKILFVGLGLVTDQSCEVVIWREATWPRMIRQIWIKRLPKTGRVSRLPGGLQVCSLSLGPPIPMTMARRVTRTMSKNRNCRSLRLVINWKDKQWSDTFHCELLNENR